MNFSESTHNPNREEALIQSLQLWWQDAGVDLDFHSVHSSLLAKTDSAETGQDATMKVSAKAGLDLTSKPVAEKSKTDSFPDALEPFLAWLQSEPNVPGQQGLSDAVFPYGVPNPDVMIIVAMPDSGRLNSQSMFSVQTEKLVKNMLRAINVEHDSVFFASLSLTRPIEGRIDQMQYDSLNRRMQKLIELVAPKHVIIFGDTTTRAIFGEELLSARKKKLFVNQGSARIEAVATFHPRILIERPEIKVEAWKDLQPLLGTASP